MDYTANKPESVLDEKSSLSIEVTEIDTPTLTPTSSRCSTSSTSSSVRVLGIEDYKAAAATLADAFSEDHVAWYFLDTPDRAHWSRERKWELHVKILEYITYAHCMKGLVVSAGPDHDCVALW